MHALKALQLEIVYVATRARCHDVDAPGPPHTTGGIEL